MNSDSRISRAELAELLQAASELQAQEEGALENSLTVEEAESVAAEAGIGREFMRAAARALRARPAGWGNALLGPPSVWVAEQAFSGPLTAAEANRLIAEAQASVPIAGGTIDEVAPGVWRLSHEDRAVVQVTAVEGGFQVALVSDRRLLRMGLLGGGGIGGGFVGVQVAGALAFAFAPMSGAFELFALGLPAGGLIGGMAGVAAGAAGWRLAAERWRARTDSAFARIRDAVSGRATALKGGGPAEAAESNE